MTLILSCITNDYVIQVSDRRLFDLRSGKPCSDHENKAVSLCGNIVFGYTGLANINGIPTDWWLSKVLLGTTQSDLLLEKIRYEATKDFKKIFIDPKLKIESHIAKKQTFAGVGWVKIIEDNTWKPIFCWASNYHDQNGNELERSMDEFSCRSLIFNNLPRENSFILAPIGYPIGKDISNILKKELKRCLKHENITPKTLLRFIVKAVRQVADKSKGVVGKDLLACIIPKKAAGKYIRFPDGRIGITISSSPYLESESTFQYLPDGQYDGNEYGPNFVVGNSWLSSYSSFKDIKNGQLSMEVRTMELEQGATQGLLILENERKAQIITLPPNFGKNS